MVNNLELHKIYTIKTLLFKRNLTFDELLMCGSRKYQYPPHGRSLEIPGWEGSLNSQNYKGKYEVKLEIPRGREGSNKKTFHGGGMDIFWNHTILA